MFLSVVIPTYNRLPILQKCLRALEQQRLEAPISNYEVVVVDDGSTDETVPWLLHHGGQLPHVRLVQQDHGGPAEGRNRGVDYARGDVIVFIDSDLVVTEDFLISHARRLEQTWHERGDRLCFTYGAVINTANFEDPTSEPHKLRDLSWAYFLVRCPEAVGYHWHPALSLEQVPRLIAVEGERAKMGLVFYRKHPTRRVRFIIQFTVLHRLLWELLTLGGLVNERSLRPLLAWLIRRRKPGLAMELLRLPLNRIGVRALYAEARAEGIA